MDVAAQIIDLLEDQKPRALSEIAKELCLPPTLVSGPLKEHKSIEKYGHRKFTLKKFGLIPAPNTRLIGGVNTAAIIKLLEDGVPRKAQEIADALSIHKQTVHDAFKRTNRIVRAERAYHYTLKEFHNPDQEKPEPNKRRRKATDDRALAIRAVLSVLRDGKAYSTHQISRLTQLPESVVNSVVRYDLQNIKRARQSDNSFMISLRTAMPYLPKFPTVERRECSPVRCSGCHATVNVWPCILCTLNGRKDLKCYPQKFLQPPRSTTLEVPVKGIMRTGSISDD